MASAATRTFALSVHADYACRHSGACCTAGWSIPVEPRIRHLLGAEVLTPDRGGACEQFDAPSGLCRVHRDHGDAMLPASCYHFPRRALLDERGTFITLSHYCPTAASQLFRDDVGLDIVEAPPAFPAARDYDPLDGRETWPPLVHPHLLFDHESYARWERFIVNTFAIDQPVHGALAAVAATAEQLRAWTPDHGVFRLYVERLLARAPATVDAHGSHVYDRYGNPASYAHIIGTIPDGLPRPRLELDIEHALAHYVGSRWHQWSTPVRRYLASKAFGSWSAYQGRGVRTLVAELVASELVVRVEAARACAAAARSIDRGLLHEGIRQADWLLMHLANREELIRWFAEAEG